MLARVLITNRPKIVVTRTIIVVMRAVTVMQQQHPTTSIPIEPRVRPSRFIILNSRYQDNYCCNATVIVMQPQHRTEGALSHHHQHNLIDSHRECRHPFAGMNCVSLCECWRLLPTRALYREWWRSFATTNAGTNTHTPQCRYHERADSTVEST